jgi:hypothetical protein
VRTAKKIQKDMEKWAKMLNQKKESQKVAAVVASAPPALTATAAPSQKGETAAGTLTLLRAARHVGRFPLY